MKRWLVELKFSKYKYEKFRIDAATPLKAKKKALRMYKSFESPIEITIIQVKPRIEREKK